MSVPLIFYQKGKPLPHTHRREAKTWPSSTEFIKHVLVFLKPNIIFIGQVVKDIGRGVSLFYYSRTFDLDWCFKIIWRTWNFKTTQQPFLHSNQRQLHGTTVDLKSTSPARYWLKSRDSNINPVFIILTESI